MMQIKIIYEDAEILSIQEQIAKLETKQLFFIERFIKQEKEHRKQEIFIEWQKELKHLMNQ